MDNNTRTFTGRHIHGPAFVAVTATTEGHAWLFKTTGPAASATEAWADITLQAGQQVKLTLLDGDTLDIIGGGTVELEGFTRRAEPKPVVDLRAENHGSICLVRPVSEVGRTWLDDHVADESMWYGGALVVEPRYLFDLLDGAANDGLEVRQ